MDDDADKKKGKVSQGWWHWLAGGGLAIFLSVMLVRSNASDATKTREFFISEFQQSKKDEREDRAALVGALTASAVATAQGAAAQQQATGALNQAAEAMQSMRGEVAALRCQQEQLVERFLAQGGK